MIKGIDLSMKWNDYPSDTIYLWNGTEIFQISEGDGSNLSDEDEAEGCVDYWMTYFANKENGDGGMWTETKLITETDYTIQGVIDRIMECDLWDDDWKVVDEDLGNELIDAFEDYWKAKRLVEHLSNKAKED